MHERRHLGGQAPWRPASAGRTRWYLNRLRCMSPAEVAHRVTRALAIRAERYGLLENAPSPAPDLTRSPSRWVAPAVESDIRPYIEAADRIVEGELDVFALEAMRLGSPPRWNRDPKTGIEAPLTFGKLLDYRDPSLVGDIKYLWEPNRHLHLVTLAQAHALSSDARYFEALRAQLESWLDACPYGLGPNWSSALEPAIRLINWAIAWQLLGGAGSPVFAAARERRFRDRWLRSVHEHARFIRGHFSLYSSANNHLIGEAAGLFIASVSWPHWPETNHWIAESRAILEREVLVQNCADGVNREQSVAYEQFELDLLVLALLAGRAAGIELSRDLSRRIEAMIEHLGCIMDVGGNVPAIGDSDDGFVVRLSQEKVFCPYRSLLASGALLFERADFKAKARSLDDKTRWLLGPEADTRYDALSVTGVRPPARRSFPDGGYYVLGCDFETPAEIKLVADAGPLGYGAIAAHGHADALSFTLAIGGNAMLIDPGTYTYRSDSPWRAYFRGTAAHNTIRVDGRDQSEPGGTFLWLDKAQAGCDRWHSSAERDVFEGWHDGYLRLTEPVLHRRRITLDKRARRIVIEDRLETSGEHDVELMFHCSERCRVHPAADNAYVVEQDGARLLLRLPQVAGSRAELHRGRRTPIRGWASTRFGEKRPSPTLVWTARLGRCRLRSEVDILI